MRKRELTVVLGTLCQSILMYCAVGCGEHPAPTEQTASDERLRIVSLSPAISRTLVDFGLQTRVVGRTPFCRSIDQSVPVVGDVTTIAFERLIRLRPTHVLAQPPSVGLDPKLIELGAEHAWTLGLWPNLDGVEDIKRLIQELPSILYAQGSDELKLASHRAEQLLDAVVASLGHASGESLFRGRILLLSGLEPVMSFGYGTYLHDILMQFGAENVVSAQGWVQLSMEDIIRLNPEAIVLVLDVQPDRAPTSAHVLKRFSNLNIAAARKRRLAVIAHRDSLLPSSGIIPVAHRMRALLHDLARVPQ